MKKRRRILSLLALTFLISNGAVTLARAATWSTTDLRSGAALPSGTVVVNHVTVIWQVRNYISDAKRADGGAGPTKGALDRPDMRCSDGAIDPKSRGLI